MKAIEAITGTETIIELSTEVSTLREVLADAENRLHEALTLIRNKQPVKSATLPPTENAHKSAPKGTIGQQILAILANYPDKTFSTLDLMPLIPGTPRRSLQNEFARLVNNKKVLRMDKGQYRHRAK